MDPYIKMVTYRLSSQSRVLYKSFFLLSIVVSILVVKCNLRGTNTIDNTDIVYWKEVMFKRGPFLT